MNTKNQLMKKSKGEVTITSLLVTLATIPLLILAMLLFADMPSLLNASYNISF